MPLEISEIGVHVAVGEAGAVAKAKAPAVQGGSITPAQQEEIVAACVKEVLRHLRMRDER